MTDPRHNMRVLACAGFVSGITIRIAEPLLPRIAEDFGVGVSDAAVVLTGFALAYGLFQLAHGRISDRFGVLRTVAVAMALASVATGVSALSTSLDELAVLRFLTGMTAGAIIPLSFAYVGDHVPFEDRQPVLGRFIGGILTGQMVGPVIGGLLSDSLGWRLTFLVPAVAFALIALALAPAAMRDRRAPRSAADISFVGAYLSLVAIPRVRRVCGAVSVEGLLFYGAFGFVGAWLKVTFDASYSTIGVVMAGFGLGGIVYSATVRTVVQRIGIPRLVLVAGGLLGLGLPTLAAVESVVAAGVVMVVLGFGFYGLHNTLQTRATEMAPSMRGTAVAFFAFALFTGQAVGIELAALAIDAAGYGAVFAVAGAGLAALAALLAARLDRF